METPATTAPAEQRASLLPTALIGAAFLVVAVIFASHQNWYLAFKTVHVIFAVIWIGGGALLTILGVLAERRNDPVELATIARQAAMVGEKLFSPAALVVLAMGIAMMINTDWGWGSFWIDFGLAGFASTFALGIGVLAPLAKKICRRRGVRARVARGSGADLAHSPRRAVRHRRVAARDRRHGHEALLVTHLPRRGERRLCRAPRPVLRCRARPAARFASRGGACGRRS